MNQTVWLGLTIVSCSIWLVLLGFRGGFWRCDLEEIRLAVRRWSAAKVSELGKWPSVCAIVPARNEADLIGKTLRSLLSQDYPGSMRVILVDDRSTDGTANVAKEIAVSLNKEQTLEVITGEPLATGWTGKLWAMAQGLNYAGKFNPPPDYFLLTDADIEHHQTNVNELVIKAEEENLDLVSLMVLLRCEDFWEKLLIPAFVFFFQKLYPFPWVNDPNQETAAAAGGCILIRRQALEAIGGIEIVRDALIDDCALAKAVKSRKPDAKIWLGLTQMTCSLRPYPELKNIWDMVARTAFTQLNYSPFLLIGSTLGMTMVYLVTPVALVLGIIWGNGLILVVAFANWLLMAVAYLPTLKLYRRSPWLSFSLPAIAFLYTLMTVDSALRHWRGKGGAWKGRVYGTADEPR